MLGFFDESTVGPDRTPVLSNDADHESFSRHVSYFFPELPLGDGIGEAPVFRDENGVLTIFNWKLLGRNDIADAIMALQRKSGCDVVQRVRWNSQYLSADLLPQHFQYYTVEFQKVVDHWQKFYEDMDALRKEADKETQ